MTTSKNTKEENGLILTGFLFGFFIGFIIAIFFIYLSFIFNWSGMATNNGLISKKDCKTQDYSNIIISYEKSGSYKIHAGESRGRLFDSFFALNSF